MTDSPHRDDDPLVFTPVPTSSRHDGWTAERQRAFIAALAEHGGITPPRLRPRDIRHVDSLLSRRLN